MHIIHGLDVARLTFRVTQDFTPGERWIVTDLRVYDWYELILGIDEGQGSEERRQWVQELLEEEQHIQSLPRQAQELGRALDSKEVWTRFKLVPMESLYRPR